MARQYFSLYSLQMSSSKFLKAHCSFRALNTVSAKMNSIKRTLADSRNIYIINWCFRHLGIKCSSWKQERTTFYWLASRSRMGPLWDQHSATKSSQACLTARGSSECSQAAGNSAPVEGMEMMAQNKLGEAASTSSGEQSRRKHHRTCARERLSQPSVGSWTHRRTNPKGNSVEILILLS